MKIGPKILSEDSLTLLYKIHNIHYERCELYRDFTLTLLDIIVTTYMGDDVTSPKEQIEHFNWCWNHTINKFKEERINLNDDYLKKYFMEFVLNVYYILEEKENNKPIIDNMFKLFSTVLDYNLPKSQNDFDYTNKIYQMFDSVIN